MSQETKTNPIQSSKNKEHVVSVDIRNIVVLPGRGRKSFQKVPALAESIRQHGLIHPVVVKPSEKDLGKYDLIAGERRYRAHLILWMENPVKFSTIDTIDRQFADPVEIKEVELEENLQRENLEWQEQCELLRQIDDLKRKKYGDGSRGTTAVTDEAWTTAKTANLVGESRRSVESKIAIAKKFDSRPDLKEKVKNLPLSVAIREIDRIENAERTQRLADSGQLKLHEQLLRGGCDELLRNVPSDSIDMVDIDPPFGIPVLDDLQGENRGSVKSYTSILKDDDNATATSVERLMGLVIPELFRVMKPTAHGFMFFAFECYEVLKQQLTKAGFVVNPVPIIWDKGRDTSGFLGYWAPPRYEPIMHFIKPPVAKRLHESLKTIIEFSPVSRNDKKHPFQKPEELHTYLISRATNVGDKVLDCFAGSGSALLASLKLGRSVVGIEKDSERYLEAQRRIEEYKSGSGR